MHDKMKDWQTHNTIKNIQYKYTRENHQKTKLANLSQIMCLILPGAITTVFAIKCLSRL